jgi:hypothetical protein
LTTRNVTKAGPVKVETPKATQQQLAQQFVAPELIQAGIQQPGAIPQQGGQVGGLQLSPAAIEQVKANMRARAAGDAPQQKGGGFFAAAKRDGAPLSSGGQGIFQAGAQQSPQQQFSPERARAAGQATPPPAPVPPPSITTQLSPVGGNLLQQLAGRGKSQLAGQVNNPTLFKARSK